jgi:hypothetical protein
MVFATMNDIELDNEEGGKTRMVSRSAGKESGRLRYKP